MTGSIDVGAFVSSIVYLVPLIGCIVSIIALMDTYRKRREQTAAAATELKIEIRHLSSEVDSLKQSIDGADEGYHRNAERLTKLEQQARSLEARMKNIETEVRNGR